MRKATTTYLLSMIVLFNAACRLALAGPSERPDDPAADPNDVNDLVVAKLDLEARNAMWLVEAVRWPSVATHDKYGTTKDPNAVARAGRLVQRLVQKEHLVDTSQVRTYFLKGWRAKDRESFVVEWTKGDYIFRVKDQVTSVQVAPHRSDRSFWYVILLKSQNGKPLVDRTSKDAVFSIINGVLPDTLNSKAQDFTNVVNRKEALFLTLANGSILMYPVRPQPIIEAVYVWTDGKQMIITLKKIAEHYLL